MILLLVNVVAGVFSAWVVLGNLYGIYERVHPPNVVLAIASYPDLLIVLVS